MIIKQKIILFSIMSTFNLVNDWRKLLREQDSEPPTPEQIKKLSVKKDTPEYDKLVKTAEKEVEKATEKPSEKPDVAQKTKMTKVAGTIKHRCKCVDDSESSLPVSRIKELINKYYESTSAFKQLDVNDTCDLKTKKAIMQFQADTGCEQDACVGDETEMAFVKVGVLEKKTKSYVNDAPGANTPVAGGPVGGVSGFSSGQCISIKANKVGKAPNSKAPNNYHGYGVNSHPKKGGITADDAYMVNGVYFGDIISGAPGIAMRPQPKIKQYGNPLLANIIKAAAAAAQERYPRDGGEAWIGSVALGTCWNKKERKKDPSLPCIQGGWGPRSGGGPNTGTHRYGHQSGLEADVTFYRTKGGSAWWDPVDYKFSTFDYGRNAVFTETLLASSQIEMVLVGYKITKAMQKWIRKNKLESDFPNIMSEKKLGRAAGSGHDDHYHVRAYFPEGSPNMKQFMAAIKSGGLPAASTPALVSKSAEGSAGPGTINSVRSRIKSIRGQKAGLASKIKSMFTEMRKLSLTDLQSMYGKKFGYALGTINKAEPTVFYNAQNRFYGASSQKIMAALAQLIKYSGTPQALNDIELGAILGYTKMSGGSNKVNRALSMAYRRRQGKGSKRIYRRSSGSSLGAINKTDVAKIANIFGIENSNFLYGKSNNQQSPRDMFKFFAGMQRMVAGGGTPAERQLYKRFKKEVDAIIKAQKIRKHSEKVKFSGIKGRNHWGKGGRALGAVSHSFVVDEKYVLSVYVDFGKNSYPNDFEEYALLNTVISKLLEKAR